MTRWSLFLQTLSLLLHHFLGLYCVFEMIPAQVIPWATWKSEHPKTLVLNVGLGLAETSKVDPFDAAGRDYLAGVVLGENAKAYPFAVVSQMVVVNDTIGTQRVVVYANPTDKSVHIFLSRVGATELEFARISGGLQDKQTGTRWDPVTGAGMEGPLGGEILEEFPYSTANAWAWKDLVESQEVV